MSDFMEGCSIITGAVRYKDLAYLLATNDALIEQGVAHTLLVVIDDGHWGGFELDWLAGSVAVCHEPQERVIAIERHGTMTWAGGGGQASEEPFDHPAQPPANRRGYIRECREIAGGKLYAAGTGRQLYRREAPGQWTRLDIWHADESDEILERSFESVDGYCDTEIYTAGWEGEIWRFDGTTWTLLASDSDTTYHKVLCAPGGQVFVAGSEGSLLVGLGDRWRAIEHGDTEEDIWGLAWFNDRLYLSTSSAVYSLENDRLVLVDFGDCTIPSSCYHLSAADGVMWSIGAKDVMQFDGEEWTRIL